VATITPASATEGSDVVFNFTLSNNFCKVTTYTFVLTNGTGADYTTTNVTVTVPAGATTGTVSVPTTVDTIDEVDETFSIANGTVLLVLFSMITIPTVATITPCFGYRRI
jgi:hypothetical protein